MSGLERGILQGLAWHSLFQFPLTAEEARLSSSVSATLAEILAGLSSLQAAGKVGEREGLFFLAGHEGDVDTRHVRYAFAERKFVRAQHFFRLASALPFVRAVFVCNTLARGGARDGSDIDFLVVSRPGHLWTCRLFVTGLAKVFGIRPTASDARDGICLSFFAAEDALDFQTLAIEGDAYLPRWLADCYPVYDSTHLAERLFAANPWVRETLPNALMPRASRRRTLRAPAPALQRLAESLAGFLEPIAKSFQLRIMPEALKGGGVGVTINDRILKFHDHDRRAELRDRHQTLCSSFS